MEWNQGEPLLMTASLAMFGKGGSGHEVYYDTIFVCSMDWIFNYIFEFVPAWQLDGGHMARTLLGPKMAQICNIW